MARAFVAAPIFLMLVVLGASAQSHVDELRSRLESRFEIVPIANGVVLTPRFRTSIKSVELSSSTIAIDGAPVTGQELHDRLGNDAALILAAFLSRSCGAAVACGRQNAAEAGGSDGAHDRSRFHVSRESRSAAHAARAPARRHRSHRRFRVCRQR